MATDGKISVFEVDDGDLALGDVFWEPPRPPSPEPTIEIYERIDSQKLYPRDNDSSWSEIRIRLVGSHPLWGHYLWNAARAFANYLDEHPQLYRNKDVLELGAGGGLPGLVTVLNGSRQTVLTDYPDFDLLKNLSHNVSQNIPESIQTNVMVLGHTWGASVDSLLRVAPEGFDLIILSDLVFNHSQHDALLKTCQLALRRAAANVDDEDASPALLVFYTHHRPHLAQRDLGFFAKAKEQGWVCKEIINERHAPMFPEDHGEETVRSTVHGWRIVRKADA